MAALYAVPVEGPGALVLMACPQVDGFDALREAGVTHVVSLLPEDQAVALGMAEEAVFCAGAGLRFRNFPIADFGVPERDAFAVLVQEICGWLAQGAQVAVHCRAGIGRSGTLAACVKVAQGMEPAEAMAVVSAARGVAIPETAAQRDFVTQFQQAN